MRSLAHIHQTTELAERVLLPGDPGRALRIAQELLEAPKMLNHNRGLWGYTGTAPDGGLLSVQSTGIGGPSTAIVAGELIELGARRLIRVGTCRGLLGEVPLGQLLVVAEVLAGDGTSQALGGHPPLTPLRGSPTLTAALCSDGGQRATVVSTDLPHGGGDGHGAVAGDLATAALFAVAARDGVQAACALVVSSLRDSSTRLEGEALHAAEIELGRRAIAALS